MPEEQVLARVFARKAEGDRKAMRLLASDPEIDDESVGFHAQQAIEKWIKAVMASRGLPEERIHDLTGLLEILAAAEIEPPPGSDRFEFLTLLPFRCATTRCSMSYHSIETRSWHWSTKSATGRAGLFERWRPKAFPGDEASKSGAPAWRWGRGSMVVASPRGSARSGGLEGARESRRLGRLRPEAEHSGRSRRGPVAPAGHGGFTDAR